MKGVWRCDAITSGVRCRHHQVHLGHDGTPLRIDVQCNRCGTRHQYRVDRKDKRGRESRIHYTRFPEDVSLTILIMYASKKNRKPQKKSTAGFRRASEIV